MPDIQGAMDEDSFRALWDEQYADVLATKRPDRGGAMTDVLDMLKQADPVDTRALRAEGAPHETLEAILAAASPATRRRRPRPLRVLLPAGGAVLALAVVALLVVGGRGQSVDTAAAAALREVAGVARTQPAVAPGPGQFLYLRVESRPVLAMDDFRFRVLVPSTQEVWLGEDLGRLRNASGEPSFLSDRDRRAWIAAGRPRLPGGEVDEGELDRGLVPVGLPTDPDALLAELEQHAEDGDHGYEYIFSELIRDGLRDWGTTPKQQAALYEVAARLPGIELLGARIDREGRRGIGFAMNDEDGHRATLIVDPETAELLASTRVTLPESPIQAGTVVEDSIYRRPAIVDAIGERP